jgi:hypothetical protein
VRTSAFVHSRRSAFLSADMRPSMRVTAGQDGYSTRLLNFCNQFILLDALLCGRQTDVCSFKPAPCIVRGAFFVPSPLLCSRHGREITEEPKIRDRHRHAVTRRSRCHLAAYPRFAERYHRSVRLPDSGFLVTRYVTASVHADQTPGCRLRRSPRFSLRVRISSSKKISRPA